MNALAVRLWNNITEDLRALNFSSPTIQPAIRSALVGIIACIVAFALALDQPWWAGLTGFVAVRAHAIATLRRCMERVSGTVVGAAIGYFLSALLGLDLLFEIACIVVTTFTIYVQARSRYPHAVLFGGITVLMVMFGSLDDPASALHLAANRAAETTVGVCVASLVDYVFARHIKESLLIKKPMPPIFAFPIDKNMMAIALIGGISVAAIPLVWRTFLLPGFDQTPFTALIILGATGKGPVWKAANRFTGGLIGGAYGLLAMHFAGDNFVLWALLLFIGLFCAAHIEHRARDAWYVGMQIGITIIAAMVQGLAPSDDIIQSLDRITGILGGVVMIAVFRIALEPFRLWLIGPAPEKLPNQQNTNPV